MFSNHFSSMDRLILVFRSVVSNKWTIFGILLKVCYPRDLLRDLFRPLQIILLKIILGPLMDGIYWETFYNGDKIPDDQTGYIFFENKLLGVPRIRQVKVRNDSCVVHRDFADDIKEFGFTRIVASPWSPIVRRYPLTAVICIFVLRNKATKRNVIQITTRQMKKKAILDPIRPKVNS